MSTAKDAGGDVSAAAKDQSSRRALLKSGALAGVAAVGGLLSSQRAEGAEEEFYRAKKGRINQSVVDVIKSVKSQHNFKFIMKQSIL